MTNLVIALGEQRRRLKTPAQILRVLLPAAIHGQIPEILRDPAARIEELLAQGSDFPLEYRFLLHRMSALEPRRVQVLSLTRSGGRESAIAAQVGGRAELELAAVEGEDEIVALGVGFTAAFNFGASARLRQGILSAGFASEAAGDQRIRYEVVSAGRERAILPLLRLSTALSDPSDLRGVVAAIDSGHLRRVSRCGNAGAILGVDIGIGQAFSRAFPDAGIDLGGQLGGSLRVEYRDAAAFELSVARLPRGYVVEMLKNRRSSTSSLLRLGVDVKLVGLRDNLLGKVSALLPEGEGVGALLQQIDGFAEGLTEQTLKARLRDELSARWEEVAPVFALLVGEQSASDLAEQIRRELEQKILDELSAAADLINQQTHSVVSRVTHQVTLALGLDRGMAEALTDYVGSATELAVEAFKAEFARGASGLIPQSQLVAALQPFEFIGEEVSQVIRSASRNGRVGAAAVRGAIAAVYARYTGFRAGVIAALKHRLEEEFSVAVVRHKHRTESVSRSIRIQFTEYSDELGAVYRDLWNGDLRELAGRLQALADAPGVRCDGEYVTTLERVNRTSFDLNIFGYRLAAATALADTVVVGYDLNGRLIAAATQAEFERFHRNMFSAERQSITARWSRDFLHPDPVLPPVRVELRVTDQTFKRREVPRFFRALEAGGVTRPGMGDEVLGAAFRQDQNALRNAELKLIVTLDSGDWRDLMERAQPIDVTEKLLREVSAIDPEQTERAVDYFRSWSGRGERRPRRMSLLEYLLELGDKVHYAGACRFQGIPQQQDRTGFGRVHRLARALRLLHDRLQIAQAKWRVLPHGGVPVSAEPAADIAAFNQAFAGVFGAIFAIRNLDSGAVSCLTAAGIALFMDCDRGDAPNPYLPCVVSADSLQELLIS